MPRSITIHLSLDPKEVNQLVIIIEQRADEQLIREELAVFLIIQQTCGALFAFPDCCADTSDFYSVCDTALKPYNEVK